MATIPMIIPTIEPTARGGGAFSAPNVAPVENLGARQMAQMGEATLKAGLVSMGIAQQIQSDLDDAKTKELDMALADRIRENLYNAESGYMNSVGKTAVDRRQPTDEMLTKARQDIEAGLENDVQRMMFKQIADRRMLAARADMDRHSLQQLKVYNIGESKARVDNLTEDAVVNSQSWNQRDGQFQVFKNAMQGEVKNFAQISGIPIDSDQYKAMQLAATTRLHSRILGGLIDTDKLDEAREYLKSYGGEINAEARSRIDKALDIGTFEAKTQGLTESILTEAQNDPAKALELARQKLSGKEEDAVVQRIKVKAQEDEAFAQRRRQELGRQAWSFVMDGKKIPTTVASELIQNNPEEMRQIRDWQEAKRRQAEAQKQEGFGFDTYYGLVQMAIREPDQFTGLDLRKSQPYLTRGQLGSLVQMQVGLGKQDSKAMQSQQVLKSTLDMIKSEVAAAGIDLTPKEGTKQAKQTAQFMGALSLALTDATQAKGSPLTQDEARRIGMSMVREGIEQGSGIFGLFATKKRGYEIATDQNIRPGTSFIVATFSDIPKAVRDQLVESYVNTSGKQLKRSIYGDRSYILDDQDKAAIERAYTQGVNMGRFK